MTEVATTSSINAWPGIEYQPTLPCLRSSPCDNSAILVSTDRVYKAVLGAVFFSLPTVVYPSSFKICQLGKHNDGPARLRMKSLVVVSSSSVKWGRKFWYVSSAADVTRALPTVNRVRIVFAAGPSRFLARFHRVSSRDECEVVDLYFRAEPWGRGLCHLWAASIP